MTRAVPPSWNSEFAPLPASVTPGSVLLYVPLPLDPILKFAGLIAGIRAPSEHRYDDDLDLNRSVPCEQRKANQQRRSELTG